MKDINFWIGTGVGFVSALLGALVAAWVQHRFKINEIKYTVEQEKVKRKEEELARKEAERTKLRELIMDIRDFKERGMRDEYTRGFLGDSRALVIRWYESGDYERDRLLKGMDVNELKALYTGLLSTHFLSTETEGRGQGIERRLDEMSATLRHLYLQSTRADDNDPQPNNSFNRTRD